MRRRGHYDREMRTVALALFAGARLFDVAVASEVWAPRRSEELPAFELRRCAATPAPVLLSDGAVALPERTLAWFEMADLVIVPGMDDPQAEVGDDLITALRAAHRSGKTIAALCAGAFVLAAAGLLDGRPAITHWALCDDLARRYPLVSVKQPPSTNSPKSTPTPRSPPSSTAATSSAAPANHYTPASSARSARHTNCAATPNDSATPDCSPSPRSPASSASHPTPSKPGATKDLSPDASPTTKASTSTSYPTPTYHGHAPAAHPATPAPPKPRPHQPQGAQYETTSLSFGLRTRAGSVANPQCRA